MLYSKEPKIHFMKCGKCGAVTYDKIWNQEKVKEYYEDSEHYYTKHFGDSGEGCVTFYGTQRLAKHIYRYCRPISKNDNLRILDFGGGDGKIGYEVAKYAAHQDSYSNIEVTVVDYCTKLCNTTGELGIHMNHVFPVSEITDAHKYDIVIASAVLEHLTSPACEIQKLFSLIKTGGAMYCRTPYMFPLYRFLKKIGIEYDTLYPEHIWDEGAEWYQKLPKVFNCEKEVKLEVSKPSIVETSLKKHFFIAMSAYLLKAPWYLCHKWQLVGGWEAVYRKKRGK